MDRRSFAPKPVTLLGALLIASCVLLVLVRVRAVERAVHTDPGVSVTSGCEEESLRGLWDATHGRPVYDDSSRIPYHATYFNWLFYATYREVLRPLVAALGPKAILIYGRILSACLAALGVAGFMAATWRASAGLRTCVLALGFLVFSGPLVGWWVVSVRPDVGAFACESVGLAIVLTCYRKRPFAAAAGGALLFAAAWSFKQTYVFGGATAVGFLLYRRAWRPAFTCAGLMGALVLACWWGAGPAYRETMRAMATDSAFALSEGMLNLEDALVKTAPLCLAAALALLIPRWRDMPPGQAGDAPRDLRSLGLIGLAISFPLSFVACCKTGAWSNYYFFASLMLAFVAVSGSLQSARFRSFLAAAFLLALLLQGAALSGLKGTVDLTPQAQTLAARWQAWQAMPEPRFSADLRLNLPWLNPGSPAFVLAYNYNANRRRQRVFESGGLGGLIEQGYFAALMLPSDTAGTYDGGRLTRYRRAQAVGDMTLYLRIGADH